MWKNFRKPVGLGFGLALMLSASGADLFRLNLDPGTVGQTPGRTERVPGGTADLPSGLEVNAPDEITVAESLPGLEGLALQFRIQDSSRRPPVLEFRCGAVTGTLTIRFELSLLAYTAPGDRAETLCNFRVPGVGMITVVGENRKPRHFQWNPEGGGGVRLFPAELNRRYAFEFRLDTVRRVYTIRCNGEATAVTDRPFTPPGEYTFTIGSGWAIGGKDGKVTFGVNRIVLSDESKDGLPPARKSTAGVNTPPGIGDWDGKTASAPLSGPYVDYVYQNIPFGRISFYLLPWRSYLDTWPGRRHREVGGFNWYLLPEAESAATLKVLAEAGFRNGRIEIGWGSYRFDDDSLIDPGLRERLAMTLRQFRENGIRPLILLNANAGAPCPMRGRTAELLEPAPAGARQLKLRSSEPLRIGYTGLRGQFYATACPLITRLTPQPDGSQLAELSRPLAKALPTGKLELTELKYQPFAGNRFQNGDPNPAADETVAGWCNYVRQTLKLIRELVKSDDPADAGFDVEVWNEYTFGSEFLNERNYYEPERAFSSFPSYRVGAKEQCDAEIFLPLTVELAAEYPGVRVISGFANQRPWDNGTDMWPGQGGFSRHYYTGVNPRDNFSDNGLVTRKTMPPHYLQHAPVNALGRPLDADGNRNWQEQLFVPEHRISLPEYPALGIKTENVIRDLRPFPSAEEEKTYFHGHFRYAHPGTGVPARMVESEFNLYRAGFGEFLTEHTGLSRNDPRLAPALHALGAKAMLRSLVFYGHKGFETLYFYAPKQNDFEFGMLPEAFFRALARTGGRLTPEVRAAIGPQLAAAGRTDRLLGSGRELAATRALTVEKLVEFKPRLVFRGNGTPEAPDRYHRDDFVVLPYQLDQDRYAIGCYVMTRDLLHSWKPELDILDPERYAMPEQEFELTLGNLRGTGAKVSLFDPLTGRTLPVRVTGGDRRTLSVRFPAVDYPRFLLIQEQRPGPLVEAPVFRRDGRGGAVLEFTANCAGEATVSSGVFPAREEQRERFQVRPGERVRREFPQWDDNRALRVQLAADGLVASWPQWDYEVAGRLFRPTAPIAPQAPRAEALPPLAGTRRPERIEPDATWQGDHGVYRKGTARFSLVAGPEAAWNRLPVVAVGDLREVSEITVHGYPAWRVTFKLAPAAHPGERQLERTCVIVPGRETTGLLELPELVEPAGIEAQFRGLGFRE